MAEQYEKAGVSLEAGYESVRRIRSHVDRTRIRGAQDSIGAFGGLFDLSCYGMKEPVLVSGTDGVGTKLLIAFAMDKHDTIGIDAVAMCVNDVLVQGARPLFFLDYIAVGKNHPEVIEQIVKGVADGCVDAQCALIGGETAEMPDMYDVHHYDVAGFCVGAADKKDIRTGEHIADGDVLIGLPSTGVHSNGFSLVRKVLFKDAKLDPHQKMEELGGRELGEVLLTPTRIYVRPVLKVLEEIDVHGMSHITGGGFFENIPRMLKDGQGVRIEKDSFPRPEIFDVIAKYGSIDEEEMYNVFNMGIGFIMAVKPEDAARTQQILADMGETSYVIGEVTESGKVEIE
ncbi:phosphoribosylformylglycinamidine cyclo-ligase [Faecalibaculum rodentium]|uniref:phosphoribosylformylglycinamidine cyclo-ligase n=2 Tax=Faecalibaculum rodentium TaxID=1702221 RepID=UPI002588C44C|nr:phosphoribosylformylglycinamidine cyclo-ligase [Faecalibaculum rodentium]